MKEGWQEYKLIELTTKIGSGATPKGGKKAYKPEGISLIRSLNVYDGEFKNKNLAFIDDDQAGKLANVEVQEGDVLLNITGASIARCCVVPSHCLPARVNQHVSIIRPLPEHVDSRFLSFLMISKEYKDSLLEQGEKAGATRQALTKAQLQNFRVVLPPLAEQKRIVAILDDAFAAIDKAVTNAKKNLANARELFNSYLSALFSTEGSEFQALSSMLSVQPRNGWSPPAKHHSDEGVPVLTLSAVTGFYYDGSCTKFTSAPTKEDAHYWLKDGELLITRSNTRPLVGHVAIYDGNPPKAICCDLIMKMTIDDSKANTRFIWYCLRSPAVRKYLTTTAKGASSTMKKIGKKVVQEIQVPIVGLDRQARIVERLDDYEDSVIKLESTYQRKLTALAELKQSILRKAFSGELTADAVNLENVA